MTLNAYVFWFEVGIYQEFEHPRGIGFWKINNNEERLRVSRSVLFEFSRERKSALEKGDSCYMHEDYCCFKHWFDEEKILRSV